MDLFGSKKRKEEKDKKFKKDLIDLVDSAYIKYKDKIDRKTFSLICAEAVSITRKMIFGKHD